ncbi:MAG TPA: AMP-binding protein, partial [Solirubrobacteraceae bacterium]
PEDHRPTPETAHRLRSAGRPMANVPVRVVDPVTLEDLPTGERGEVLIGGGHVMRRYWRNPEATAAAITPDGWLRTGDGGSMDAEGYLFLHDRLKDMIVSGGENVFPGEIEELLAGHEAIEEAAAFGVDDEKFGQRLKAFVVLRKGQELSEDDVKAYVKENLANYKVPREVVFIDELPRNPTGKVLKRELKEQGSQDGAGESADADTPDGAEPKPEPEPAASAAGDDG